MKYDNIHHFLENYEGDNVIFCYGNYAVVDMIRNLAESAGRVDMAVAVFALDNKLLDALGDVYDVVNCFDKAVDPDEFYEFGTKVFKRVVWQGWLIGNEILRSGRSYTYMDVDVVVRKNFEADMLQLHKDNNTDCLIQFNGKNCCAGFYSMRPTERTVDLFTARFFEKNKYTKYPHDQAFFNAVVYDKNILNIKFLNIDEYPHGRHYYMNHERIDGICKIIHFNCIVGYGTKIKKMKEHGCWNID